MKPRSLLPYFAITLAATSLASHGQLLLTEIQSDGTSGYTDYWELTNVGTVSVNIGNWKWIDNAHNPSDSATVTIPSGTTIAAGESIVFTNGSSASTFRTQWGIAPTVQVILGGPGLGQNDGVALYNASNVEQFYVSYAANGFTRSSGSGSLGGHAGSSAGGTTSTMAMVWDPTFGTSSPRYTFATGTTLGTFKATNVANIGSPGFSGFVAGGGPQVALSLSATSISFSESAANPASVGTVTRAVATPSALVVNLSSSDTTEATVPATVTIPANQTSATFNITAIDDTFPDGNKTATLTATATDANSPTLALTVQDDADVLDTDFMLTEIQSNQSANKPSGADDYWELTNIGTTTRDISGYSWSDNGRSGGAAAAYKLPSGTTIAAGESVVFTAMAPSAFRAWWGISNSVQVFQSVGAPGLGKQDGVSFFDPAQNELFFFSYAQNGFTREDGSPSSTDSHAGPAAGGTADSQALIWVPTSGTTTPRYTYATGSNYATFSAVAPATDLGSPGSKGVFVPTVSIANGSVTEGNSGTTPLSLVVTRASTATAFTVDYAVTGGSATAGTDFVLASGTLTFTNGGAASQPIQLQVNGDTTPEGDETVVVTLSNLVNTTGTTTLGTTQGTATILNDDALLPVITTQPISTAVTSGGTTTLTVAATGFPAPTFQWYIGNSGDMSQPISGATSASLVTPAITTATSFWARATNTAGSTNSSAATVAISSGVTSIDLSTYVRVARYPLPEPILTARPPGTPIGNLLCQEASGVAYNWDTDTLFIVGDGAKSVTQVSKTGVLIDTMTLADGSSPQGTDFYDPEGITYVGNGQFVFTEERDRQLVKFTYAAGTTLSRSGAQTVKLGTFIGNIGIEGLSYDPQTGGFICVKEVTPEGIFQTGVNFAAGTATNGSATTDNSINLFDPALLGMSDFADVFALSNLPSMAGQPQAGNLLVLSQEAARIVNTDRSGNIHSSLQIVADPGSPLAVGDQQHEGLTMDRSGNIYVVNENGGGNIDHPELWVYAPSTLPNQAPTAISLANPVNSVLENSSTVTAFKVGDISVTDDGLGTNTFSLSGADAAFFEIVNSALYLKAGTVLDFEAKTAYSVTVSVDDASVGGAPDATVNFTLNVTNVVNEGSGAPTVFISEVHPTGSSNTTYNADWFEITNAGSTALDISGWQIDDDSNGTGKIALRGVTSIPAGKSAVFFESTGAANDATIAGKFSTAWFGSATLPSGFLLGAYSGGGIGLSSGGDAVNLYDAAGNQVSGVIFGSATANVTFDNKAGLGTTVSPFPTLATKSAARVNGAFTSANGLEVGSPGTTGRLVITEVAPWGSSTAVAADWFEVTNTGATTVDITGWKMDDNSESLGGAVALNGVTSIAPGERVIFLETATPLTTIPAFLTNWFGGNPPVGLKVGSYTGSGVGLSGTNDAVCLFDPSQSPTQTLQARLVFGASPSSAPFASFDNKDGVGFDTVTQLSVAGINGAFVAKNASTQTGSPGAVANSGPLNFALWLEVNGYSSIGFNSDSNNNGVADGVEYFFNHSISKPSAGHLPTLSVSGGNRLLSFTTLNGASGVTGVLESSSDLGVSDPWTPAVLNVDYEVVSSTNAGIQTSTTLRLLGSNTTKFWRHRVIQN